MSTSIGPVVQHIRDALWRTPGNGLASVMIGAGFSLNAEPARPSARRFPLWDELANAMVERVGLDSGKPSKPRDPLLIAQMYSAMFGSSETRRLVERLIPDAENRPGEIHRRLMSLPWADVFTTNYDTLLERAREEVSERRYQLIVNPHDLPMQQAPRLVKLHGTLGSGSRLIVTQEDYRTYPERFAPFVNLVRQSVMETVFVLIGFSGDDPNFLEWTGWVRDVLGEHAPKIYLCGLLDTSPAARALLDSRRVTPVDLSEVVVGVADDQRHAKAMDWLIAALESGRPGRALNWAPLERSRLLERQPPLPSVRTFTPLSDEPSVHAEDENKLLNAAKVWRAQREEYPGWHLAPDAIRQRVGNFLDDWRREVFSGGSRLGAADRLRVARELCWRIELCLSPVFTSEADKLVEWLEAIDPFGGRLDLQNPSVVPREDAPDLGTAWLALALHVLRTAREDLDEDRFQKWHLRLMNVGVGDALLQAELRHEEVLFQWNRLDFPAYREALKSWRSAARQPLELARLAALYAELGDAKATHELGIAAVNAARASSGTPAGVALEAWSSLLLRVLHWQDAVQRADWHARVDSAKEQGYDPWGILDKLRDALGAPLPDRQNPDVNESGFDPGDIRRVKKFGRHDAALPGYRFFRFLERAPCPLHVIDAGLCAEAAARAAIWVGDGAPFWSLAVLLRAGASADQLHELFDRAAVASMETRRVGQMHEQLLRVVDTSVTRLSVPGAVPDWLEARVLPSALDLLSRIALRLSGPELIVLLGRVGEWLSSPVFIALRQLHEPLEWLMRRVIDALPDEEMPRAAIQLLRTPMLGESGCQPKFDYDWPEPFQEKPLRRRSPVVLVQRPDDWSLIWSRLIEGVGQTANMTLRERAFARLCFLREWGWLTSKEVQHFGETIWRDFDRAQGPWRLKGYYETVVLYLPGAAEVGADTVLRSRLLGIEPQEWKPNEKGGWSSALWDDFRRWAHMVLDVFRVAVPANFEGKLLAFDAADAEAMLDRMLKWWTGAKAALLNPRIRRQHFGGFDCDGVLEDFCSVLAEVVLPRIAIGNPRIAEVEAALVEMEASGFSVVRARVSLLANRPHGLPSLTNELEKLLSSHEEKSVRRAVRAIETWSKVAGAAAVPKVPEALLWLLVARVTLRQMPAFDSVVSCLSEFIGADRLPRDLEKRLLLALDPLAQETAATDLRGRYLRGEITRVAVAEGLHARAWAGLLASRLVAVFERRTEPLPAILLHWKDICVSDPLPEIRRAWRSTE